MKFDTPATTNPIDQLKVIGQPTDRIDGPLKTTGTARYAYERHDASPIPLTAMSSARRSPRAASPSMDVAARQGGARRARGRHRRQRRQARQGRQVNTAKLLGGPEIEHYHQAIAVVVAETFEQARAAAALVKVDYAARPGAFDLAAGKDSGAEAEGRRTDRRAGDVGRRFRRRLRCRGGQARRDLHHAGSGPCDDGAACLDRRLGRRQADALDVEPDDRLGRGRPCEDARHAEGEGPPDLAVHRRRLRRQAVPARRCGAGRARRASRRPSGQSGAAAAADVQQHDAPAGDDPAHPHRRRQRRQDHGDRSRKLVGQPARRQAGDGGRRRRGCFMPARTG